MSIFQSINGASYVPTREHDYPPMPKCAPPKCTTAEEETKSASNPDTAVDQLIQNVKVDSYAVISKMLDSNESSEIILKNITAVVTLTDYIINSIQKNK